MLENLDKIIRVTMEIRDLYFYTLAGRLNIYPVLDGQSFWTKQEKYRYIDALLNHYPSPGIYITNDSFGLGDPEMSRIIRDGQERLKAIVDYIQEDNDFKGQAVIPSFNSLSGQGKEDFLSYPIAVENLEGIGKEGISKISQRLNPISKNNGKVCGKPSDEGDFVSFCRQLVDLQYIPPAGYLEIDRELRTKIYYFFKDSGAWDNYGYVKGLDLKCILLLVSILVEKRYWDSFKLVGMYVEKHQNTFSKSQYCLEVLDTAVDFIAGLGLEKGGFWFRPENLFVLMKELARFSRPEIGDIVKSKLLGKLDVWAKNSGCWDQASDRGLFEGEEYFENSIINGESAEDWKKRGNAIYNLLDSSMKGTLKARLEILNDLGYPYATLRPTYTGLKKGIIDAIKPFRDFLKDNEIFDYAGGGCRFTTNAQMVLEDRMVPVQVNLYKAKTRGDERIWIPSLTEYVEREETIGFVYCKGKLYILNIARLPLEELALTKIFSC